jgi:hypothetical protein
MAATAIGLAASHVVAAPISGETKDQFLMGAVNNCTATAKRTAESVTATYSPLVIERYCACVAFREAEITTDEDVAYMRDHGELPKSWKDRVIAEIVPVCRVQAQHD